VLLQRNQTNLLSWVLLLVVVFSGAAAVKLWSCTSKKEARRKSIADCCALIEGIAKLFYIFKIMFYIYLQSNCSSAFRASL